jgi:hypothetical protein
MDLYIHAFIRLHGVVLNFIKQKDKFLSPQISHLCDCAVRELTEVLILGGRGQQRLRAFDRIVLRRIFGSKNEF